MGKELAHGCKPGRQDALLSRQTQHHKLPKRRTFFTHQPAHMSAAGEGAREEDGEPQNWRQSMPQHKAMAARVQLCSTAPGPRTIVAAPRLALAHQAKVHGRADGIAVKRQVHAAHGEQGALRSR